MPRKLSQGTDSGYSTLEVNPPSTPTTPDQDMCKNYVPVVDLKEQDTADQNETAPQENTSRLQGGSADLTNNLELDQPKGKKRARLNDSNEDRTFQEVKGFTRA